MSACCFSGFNAPLLHEVAEAGKRHNSVFFAVVVVRIETGIRRPRTKIWSLTPEAKVLPAAQYTIEE